MCNKKNKLNKKLFWLTGNVFCIRLLARDAGGETEGVLLNETVPAWVVDIVVEKKLPKFIKVGHFKIQVIK